MVYGREDIPSMYLHLHHEDGSSMLLRNVNITYKTLRFHISQDRNFPFLARFFYAAIHSSTGRDSSVDKTTRYVLEGPSFESRWRRDFSSTRTDRPCDSPSLLYNGYRVFPGDKAAGAWHWPPTPSSTEVEATVKIITALLWIVIQRLVLIPYQVSVFLTLEDGTDRLCRNVGKELPILAA